jgi:hypothetical protein
MSSNYGFLYPSHNLMENNHSTCEQPMAFKRLFAEGKVKSSSHAQTEEWSQSSFSSVTRMGSNKEMVQTILRAVQG